MPPNLKRIPAYAKRHCIITPLTKRLYKLYPSSDHIATGHTTKSEPRSPEHYKTSVAGMASTDTPKQKPAFRQIRAEYDDKTITVYQAYNDAIADAAVAKQRLDASPLFSRTRMTWVKASWSWMLYRAGYSYKDANQSRILALRMKHEHFLELLSHAHVNEPSVRAGGGNGTEPTAEHKKRQPKTSGLQVQWDPERTPKLGRLEYRSIQIGIRGDVNRRWIDEWIESIEDVTERARELKRAIDAGASDEEIKALCPEEQVYEVPDDLKVLLRMDKNEEDGQ